jgi:acyl-coenzyme A thioesterase PaaI-like protein
MLDQIQAVLAGQTPGPPISRLIGFRIASIAPGQAVVEFEAGPQHG